MQTSSKSPHKSITTVFKVVTEDLQSLGLRKNPTILTYPVNTWVSSPKCTEDMADDGGIWAAKSKSGAKKCAQYMLEKYGIKTRTFIANIDTVLYANSYRVKTNAIQLQQEINVLA